MIYMVCYCQASSGLLFQKSCSRCTHANISHAAMFAFGEKRRSHGNPFKQATRVVQSWTLTFNMLTAACRVAECSWVLCSCSEHRWSDLGVNFLGRLSAVYQRFPLVNNFSRCSSEMALKPFPHWYAAAAAASLRTLLVSLLCGFVLAQDCTESFFSTTVSTHYGKLKRQWKPINAYR